MVASMTVHPIFNSGINADDYNGDEYDGAGTNWRISPMLFDSFEPKQPLILTDEMVAVFKACPDLILPCPDNLVHLPRPLNVDNINAPGNVYDAPRVPSTIRATQSVHTQRMKSSNLNLILAASNSNKRVPQGVNSERITEPGRVIRLKQTGSKLHLPKDVRPQRVVSSGRTIMTKSSRPDLTLKRGVRTEYLRKWR
jgi:hypothetical protein